MTIPFKILETDYTDYVIVHSCIQPSPYSYNESYMILSRNSTLSEKAQNSIKSSLHLSTLKFDQLNHSNDYCSLANTIKPEQSCPTKTIVANLDINKVLGVWYLIKQSEHELDECIAISFSFADPKETVLEITSTAADKPKNFKKIGYATFKNRTIGEFEIRLTDETDTDSRNVELPFKIFDTDYLNYLVAYSCVEYNKFLITKVVEPVWILGRNKSLSKASKRSVDEITSKNFKDAKFNKNK